MAVVELQSLTKRYGALAAVDDLTATIAHGTCVLLGLQAAARPRLAIARRVADPDRGTSGWRPYVSEPGRSCRPSVVICR